MTDLPAPVQRMIDATNAGDSEAFVVGFTDDAYLEDWGRGFTGHDEIRSWDATDNIGRQAHFEALAVRDEGAEQIVTLRVSGGGFNGESDFRFTLADGLIARMIIAP